MTRWLDRLNHFDITLKYTGGKEIKFTDFTSRIPTEPAEPEENYEEVSVINAIAQLSTANYRIARSFNQSNHSNTAVMHDTRRTQTGTRCNKTNNHSNFHTTANCINHTVTDNYLPKLEKNQTMDNNNNDDIQEPERYPRDEEGRLKYHWGADDTIMRIIKRRDNSPETKDPVRQRITLTKPGNMRHHDNKKLERQILVPRRQDEEERKQVKRIDLRLKRKEEHRVTHIGGSYSRISATNCYRNTKNPAHRQRHLWRLADKPNRRLPLPPKNRSQHRNRAHTRPLRYKNLEMGQ